MSSYAQLDLGFSSTLLVISFIGLIAAVVQAIRTQKYYGRYAIIFLYTSFLLIAYSISIALMMGATSDAITSTMANFFFHTMVTPFMYCLFFEVCRTLIGAPTTAGSNTAEIDNNNNTGVSKSFRNLPKHLYIIYFAYFWTFIIGVIAIAYSAWNSSASSYMNQQVYNLALFANYGNWAYVVLVGLLVYLCYHQLQPFIKSLSIYMVGLLIVTVGGTVTQALLADINCVMTSECINAAATVSFVMEKLIGLLGVIYAAIASEKHWLGAPTNKPAPPQQYYTYPIVGAALPPPQHQQQQQQKYIIQGIPPSTAAPTEAVGSAVGSSSQVYQQQQHQYPIVQVPQYQAHQYTGQQQPIIVQLPITTNLQHPQ